jgi:hypothetical protein
MNEQGSVVTLSLHPFHPKGKVPNSEEIPTRCSFVIEFIIPKFLKAQHVSNGALLVIRSSKLYLQPLVYMPIW